MAKRKRIPYLVLKEVAKKSGCRCWYCGRKLGIEMPTPDEEFTVDHAIPLSMGGSDNIENLLPCCRPCNIRKGVNDIDGFRGLSMSGDDGFDGFWFEKNEVLP